MARNLSVAGKVVGPVGYGMLGLSIPWAPVETSQAVKLLKQALDQGANLWNGGIFYGTPESNSLHLLNHYFTLHPSDASKVVLSIKGAFDMKSGPDGSPEGIRKSVTTALAILDGVKKIDVFQCARVDPNVPIETSMQALKELAEEGKIGGVGLSEVGEGTIRRAHAVFPVAAVEVEMSLFTPDALSNGVASTCRELGIPLIAYSPVGRGWLSGEIRSLDDLPANDFRRRMPRFQPAVFDQNRKLAAAVEELAKRKGVTTAQVAMAWVVSQGAIPIPGSTKMERVVENCEVVELSEEELEELKGLMDEMPISGERYGGDHEKLLNA